MIKKAAHPGFQLFEYLNGALDKTTAQVIETHLSVCDECASLARLVRALKQSALEPNRESQSQLSNQTSQTYGEHPDLGELASFFYAKSRRAERSTVAAHVALCSSCGEAIAQYARGEQAAAEFKSVNEAAGSVPAKAWEMIADWEDSSFAKVKPASEALPQELLTRLASILSEQEHRKIGRDASAPQDAKRVPVLVVSRSGEVRSVEFFEEAFDSTGAIVLRHSEGSARFDNKLLLGLFDIGEKDSFVVSNLIRRDTIRLEKARPDEESGRADYIIIED